jgi:hypothetical protein
VVVMWNDARQMQIESNLCIFMQKKQSYERFPGGSVHVLCMCCVLGLKAFTLFCVGVQVALEKLTVHGTGGAAATTTIR